MQAPLTVDQRHSTNVESPPLPALTTRRHVLRVIGDGGALLAVTGGGGVRAVDQGVFATGDGPTYAAWNDWQGKAGDGSLNLK